MKELAESAGVCLFALTTGSSDYYCTSDIINECYVFIIKIWLHLQITDQYPLDGSGKNSYKFMNELFEKVFKPYWQQQLSFSDFGRLNFVIFLKQHWW